MDNNNYSGTSVSEDFFAFVPPNMMYPSSSRDEQTFSCKEEKERYYYHLDHDNEPDFSDSL